MNETGSKKNREPADEDEAYWGLCPICLHNNGYLNLRREHWYVCHEHRFRWCIGANLFSTWKFESPEDWAENWEIIKDYAEIEPVLPEFPNAGDEEPA